MNLEAERNIIGSLLLRNECLDEISKIVYPEMFHSDLLGKAYFIAKDLIDKGKKFDVPTAIELLQCEEYSLQSVSEEMRTCLTETNTSATAKSYARLLADEYAADRLSALSKNLICQPNSVRSDLEKLKIALEELTASEEDSMKSLAQITDENKDSYFKDDGKKKIMTGLKDLDEILGGFDGGDMVIVGARPAVGKSALAMQFATYFCNNGLKVGYFNLEMQEKQIYERFVAAKSGIEITRIRRATRFLEGEQEKFDKANEYLSTVDHIMISTGSKRVSEIRAECRGQGFDVVIIDYMQLVKSDGRYKNNRYAEVGDISHSVKALAMDFKIPVIGLCQLNRAVEGRETKEPSMSDLRESGDFEQDASTILLLWNTNQNDDSEKCIKVEKQRQGKRGRVKLRFDGNRMKFYENESKPDENGFRKVEKNDFDPSDFFIPQEE